MKKGLIPYAASPHYETNASAASMQLARKEYALPMENPKTVKDQDTRIHFHQTRESCFEFIKMDNNSQNPFTGLSLSASKLQPSKRREETFEELIEIIQGPHEALLSRDSDLESRLAQVLHEFIQSCKQSMKAFCLD